MRTIIDPAEHARSIQKKHRAKRGADVAPLAAGTAAGRGALGESGLFFVRASVPSTR
jgi:hypothetical protein